MGHGHGGEKEYLCVDRFLADAVSARALASALELGVIDALAQSEWNAAGALAARARVDRSGFMLLAGLLRAGGVIDQAGDALGLSAEFRKALKYRDLLQAKLDFAAAVAPDFLELFTTLLANPEEFFERAKLFELFSYDRCFDSTPENRAATERWMRFTTVLTKYESAACLANHDFRVHKRMLDVGGNSGEFALRVCRANPALQATVYDLPVVCEIGRQHVRTEAEAARIGFAEAWPQDRAMPAGHDLITFKSMLHDWPAEHMQQFLDRAYDALAPQGTLMIFERGPVGLGERQLPYSMIPILLFFRSYRTAEDYAGPLREAGFVDIQAKRIDLDLPFMLLTARKRGSR